MRLRAQYHASLPVHLLQDSELSPHLPKEPLAHVTDWLPLGLPAERVVGEEHTVQQVVLPGIADRLLRV
jgi:hypothetical protein